MAFPTKDFRQIKGRVCRASAGKKYGIVLDPYDDAPFLLHHSKLRCNQANKDGDFIIGY